LVRDYDRPIDLAIETKHPTRYGGLVERRLVELLEEFDWTRPGSPARVMSFSWVALTRVKKLAPDLELVLLIDSPQSWRVTKELVSESWIAGPGIELLRQSPKVAHRLRKQGRRMHVWTVNTEEDLELCLRLGVEAVITDDPSGALAHLGHA
jgi:glycerophosphoryl diester phosphodiesterase